MNNEELIENINFADKDTSAERIAELNRLKKMLATLTASQNASTDYNGSEVNDSFARNQESIAKQIVLSNTAGKAMKEYPRQNGYSSALMLGVISFIFEIIFVALAIFMYK